LRHGVSWLQKASKLTKCCKIHSFCCRLKPNVPAGIKWVTRSPGTVCGTTLGSRHGVDCCSATLKNGDHNHAPICHQRTDQLQARTRWRQTGRRTTEKSALQECAFTQHFSLTEASKGRCPRLKQWAICSPHAQKCAQDRDCPADEKCCAAVCGPVCVKPLYTGVSLHAACSSLFTKVRHCMPLVLASLHRCVTACRLF
jgi:hypothetical protein